jgi:hypothetical protein
MGIPEGRVGGALDRLEKRGLIKKQEAIMSPGGLKPSKYEALRKKEGGEAISTKSKELEWEVSADIANGGHIKGERIKAQTKEEAINKFKKTYPKKYVDKYFKKVHVIEFDPDTWED